MTTLGRNLGGTVKGIIFNLIEDAFVADHGDVLWDQVLAEAGVSGCYTALGTYATGDLTALVAAGARRLEISEAVLLRSLGRRAIQGLAAHSPRFFEPHNSVTPFLLTLNDVIHREVRKLHVDADPPEFGFEQEGPERLVVHYRSRRQLCALAEGMIEGAAHMFGQTSDLLHRECTHQGADHCIMLATFSPATAGAGDGRR